MFEKEAKERYYKNYPVTLNIGEEERYKKVTDIWKNGAEFGYNKANEWHYPSKGEYPKVEGEYLVIFESDRTKYKGLESYYPDTKEWSTINNILFWKEIVLPEIKEK